MRKILISYGFGAGWTTWNSGEVAKIMLEYQPIIEAIEAGEKMHREHPIVLQMVKEIEQETGEEYTCVLGAEGLVVKIVYDKVRVNEYDGAESIDTPDSMQSEWV